MSNMGCYLFVFCVYFEVRCHKTQTIITALLFNHLMVATLLWWSRCSRHHNTTLLRSIHLLSCREMACHSLPFVKINTRGEMTPDAEVWEIHGKYKHSWHPFQTWRSQCTSSSSSSSSSSSPPGRCTWLMLHLKAVKTHWCVHYLISTQSQIVRLVWYILPISSKVKQREVTETNFFMG